MPSVLDKFCSDQVKEVYEEDVWPEEVESAFREAYDLVPSQGRTKILSSDGKLYGIIFFNFRKK
jgi:hypothetical protein